MRFDATIKNPLRFREALSALYGVIGSDYRYAPKDRTQYIAYLRLKRDVAPLGPQVFLGGNGGVYRSDDFGETWRRTETGAPVDHGQGFRAKAKLVGIEPRAVRQDW